MQNATRGALKRARGSVLDACGTDVHVVYPPAIPSTWLGTTTGARVSVR